MREFKETVYMLHSALHFYIPSFFTIEVKCMHNGKNKYCRLQLHSKTKKQTHIQKHSYQSMQSTQNKRTNNQINTHANAAHACTCTDLYPHIRSKARATQFSVVITSFSPFHKPPRSWKSPIICLKDFIPWQVTKRLAWKIKASDETYYNKISSALLIG